MALPRAMACPLLVAAVLTAACSRADSTRHAETTRAAAASADSALVTGVWPAELGATLVVPSDTESLVVVLYPVSGSAGLAPGAGVTLVSSAGDTVRRLVGLGAPDSLHCGDAAFVRLARPTPLTWSIGIQSSAAMPLRADSMDALSADDSTAYSVEMARLASAVNAAQASRFTGLSFTVATLRRFRVAGREVVVSQVVRRVNQEADPREERTLIVAERTAASSERFSTVHSARSEGTEDATDHFDLLSALRTSHGALVVIAREKLTGTTFDILERDPAGAWTVKWSRSLAC